MHVRRGAADVDDHQFAQARLRRRAFGQKAGTVQNRPTANQAVVVSRPVYIQKQFAPSRSKESIPMAPGVDSLNVTVAASIAMWALWGG